MNLLKLKYGSLANFAWQFAFAIFATILCIAIAVSGHPVAALVLFTLFALATNRQKARLFTVTLSVPEILTDVLDAFKYETPEVFQPGGFAMDFSSKTAVLNDKITAKIAHVPVVGNYDRANGGFKAATQDVTTLIEDVPVTLDQFKIVTVNITWLTQLASKIELYTEAVRNYGYALGKYVVDYVLAQATPANFSNSAIVPVANINLDTFDNTLRDKLNGQKAAGRGRWAIINTASASKLGQDDRVRNLLYQISNLPNAAEGYRRWSNVGGFGLVREYPDMFAGNNLLGVVGDKRAFCVASRQLDFSNAADKLGVPKVMEFYPMSDVGSGVNMTGAAWQEAGTGDVYVALGLLFGVGSGKQGGAAGTITDNAGCLLLSQ